MSHSNGKRDLLERAIAGVVNQVRSGRLPVFFRTLGLPLTEWQQVRKLCDPASADRENASADGDGDGIPPTFHGLVALLTAHGIATADAARTRWLAHAIAAACHGERHLWQDLGVDRREDVSRLLEIYFRPLFLRNTQNLKWKRFLFAELGKAQGKPDLRPPGCGECDHLSICFPPSATGEAKT